jgi:hypothetical protein
MKKRKEGKLPELPKTKKAAVKLGKFSNLQKKPVLF